MSVRGLNLGGKWTTPDATFSAFGSGEFSSDKIEITVYTDGLLLTDFFGRDIFTFPALYLRNHGVGGSLLDARNTNATIRPGGFAALTFDAHEYVQGLDVESRDVPLSDNWSLTCTALSPMRNFTSGEGLREIPNRRYESADALITIESVTYINSLQFESHTSYSQKISFQTHGNISVETFFSKYVQPTIALLQMCWQRPIGADALHVVKDLIPHEIFSTFLLDDDPARKLNVDPILYFDQMNWASWFDFCGLNGELVMLLSDLVSKGTGFLQNQLVNACVVLEDLSRIATPILGTEDSNWQEARKAAIEAVERFGAKDLVARRLPKDRLIAVGNLPRYISNLTSTLGLDFPNPEAIGFAIVDARNPLAHTTRQGRTLQELLCMLEGAVALAQIGLFHHVFGKDVALGAVGKFELYLRELSQLVESFQKET